MRLEMYWSASLILILHAKSQAVSAYSFADLSFSEQNGGTRIVEPLVVPWRVSTISKVVLTGAGELVLIVLYVDEIGGVFHGVVLPVIMYPVNPWSVIRVWCVGVHLHGSTDRVSVSWTRGCHSVYTHAAATTAAATVLTESWHVYLVPSEHNTLTQCWVNVGPTSKTAGQHYPALGQCVMPTSLLPRVCCDGQ